MRKKISMPVRVITFFLLLLITSGSLGAEAQANSRVDSKLKTLSEKAEKGVTGPLTKYHIYWKEGLHLESPQKNLRFKIGGKFIIDGGNIDADDELQRAFPDLDGSEIDFRNLSVDIFATIYKSLDVRLEIDFANVQDIKDNWIRFPKIPYLRNIRIGHMKEPFSLEELTGIKAITFMERALPVQAFSPGRNIGIRYDQSASDSHISWAAGLFWNTGSFGNFGEGGDRLTDANGYDLTVRIAGLPWVEEAGRRLLHLGLSYSHGFRDENEIRFRARPESRLTDIRLVDTGSFHAKGIDTISTELAFVYGPLSFQGEILYNFTDADAADDPNFWGYYAYLSYLLTGEQRNYNSSRGIFSGIKQTRYFYPKKRQWGSWELGLRYSHVDLNDGEINGGKENNFTAGLNWYFTQDVRLMFNYIIVNVEDRESPAIDKGDAHIFQGRFQIVY
jgi:phosphate-selective porin OprO/OprP